MEYTVLFFTHSGAIKFHRFCKGEGIPCEIMPVPRQLSSSCGICVVINSDKDYTAFVNDDEVEAI
ncbi:MAG: DUF3343 domain-containing protein, partial [Oscillospiraceae bacterium]